MKIKFYIPESQVIPTQLRLTVDDKYNFYGEAKEHYREIMDEIVRKMIWQSHDHDARWCEIGREIVSDSNEWWKELTIKVSFRVRDAG